MAETNRKNVDLDILDYYDGKIKNYVDEKASTGGGSYELPIATTEILGGVKVDGSTITADINGVISAASSMTYIGQFVARKYGDKYTYPNIGTFSVGDILLISMNSHPSESSCNSYIGFVNIVSEPRYYSNYNIATYIYHGDDNTMINFQASKESSTSTQVSLKLTNPYDIPLDIYKL